MYQSQMLDDKEDKVGKSEGGEGKRSRDVERLDTTSEKSVLIVLYGRQKHWEIVP